MTLGAEREILPRISFGLDFTYAEGNQLQRLTDINRVYSGAVSTVNQRPVYSSTRRFSSYGQIITDVSDAESEYKSVTATLQRRYSGNYSLYGAVTWSEDRDNDSNERNFSGIQAEDVNDLDNNWGPSNRDQEWKVILNGVWDTPLWGIGLSGSVQYYTGSPYTPIIGADVNGDTVTGTDRPTINGVHLGRNSERQPDLYTTSLRLKKSFGIGPTNVAVFAECFNCTDHTNTAISANNQIYGPLQTPRVNSTTGQQTFGVEDALFAATGPFGPRTFQVGLRFDF